MLAPCGALFGASQFAEALLEYMRNFADEPTKVRLLTNLWNAGTLMTPVLKPLYATALQILLSAERSGHLKAQIIAEFRRILHEEPTVLDATTSTSLFNSLKQIVSNHNPSEVDVVVDFSYGCLMKLIPQRRSVLGSALLKSIADVSAATLAQPVVAPQYLDINCCVISSVIDSCDETSATTIANICVSVSRHFSNVLRSNSFSNPSGVKLKGQLEDVALVRLANSVLGCFTSVLSWFGLPSFACWTPALYKAISTVILSSLLCRVEAVATQGAAVFARAAAASGQYLQFFVGDFSLLFIIFVIRLLHPSRLKFSGTLGGSEKEQISSSPSPASSSSYSVLNDLEYDLPCAMILDNLYSEPTTAERKHREVKDALSIQLVFLADYPTVSAITDLNSSFGQFQNELWNALNVTRAALCHILLNLIRVRGRTQQQLVELFTIWYDRMSFSGHFLLVDVLNKALMTILVKSDGTSLALSSGGASSGPAVPIINNATTIQTPLPSSAPSSSSHMGAWDNLKSQHSSGSFIPPSTSSSSSSLIQPIAHPASSSTTTTTTTTTASATALSVATFSASSSSNSSFPRLSTGGPLSPSAAPVGASSSSSSFSPSIPAFPAAPGSPTPHTMAIAQESERSEMQKRFAELEREFQALSLERSRLVDQLQEKTTAYTTAMNEKEHILNQIACAVCLENILDNKPVCLECGHLFCGNCVDTVMKSHQKCPLCKTAISKITQVKGL